VVRIISWFLYGKSQKSWMNCIRNGAKENFNCERDKLLYKELLGLDAEFDMGYVYVIYNPESNLVKIGKTKHPHKRFTTLSNQNGTKFKYYITEPMHINGLIEKIMHNRFTYRRRNGEWFDIPFDDAVSELKLLLESEDFKRRNIHKI
jgi:hypothetical protein